LTLRLLHRLALILLLQGCAGSPVPDANQGGGPRAGPRPTQALYDEIAARDRELFGAVFDRCDTKTLATLVTDDFEFYHDKGGLTAKSGAEFVGSIERMCARQKSGEDYRARREVVPGTMKVYPLANYGAVQVGEHRFYRLFPDKPEKLVEVALFTMVWKKEENGWKLARVLSYDHRLTD
jgi:ketosteroid isomerase-like protein